MIYSVGSPSHRVFTQPRPEADVSVRRGFHFCGRGFGVRLLTAPREGHAKAPLRRLSRVLRAATRGENMVSLSNWSLHSLTHRRKIRNLASALVGEIAAILHLIETHDVVSMLEKALD